VTEVTPPESGELKPGTVLAEVEYSLERYKGGPVKAEWDELKEHDVLLLLTIEPRMTQQQLDEQRAAGRVRQRRAERAERGGRESRGAGRCPSEGRGSRQGWGRKRERSGGGGR